MILVSNILIWQTPSNFKKRVFYWMDNTPSIKSEAVCSKRGLNYGTLSITRHAPRGARRAARHSPGTHRAAHQMYHHFYPLRTYWSNGFTVSNMLLYKPNAVLGIRSWSHFFYQCDSILALTWEICDECNDMRYIY